MTHTPPPLMPPEDDQIGGASTDRLLGAVIEYKYSTGRQYRLTFDDEYRVTFAQLNHSPAPGGEPFEGPLLPYRAREIRPGLVLVHWIVKEPSIHVSLTIDLDEKKLHVAAMMPPNRWEFWDTAEITLVSLRD